jgi:hypothetical protein
MKGPLVRAQRVVETRLLRLGQKLNAELGYRDQRLLFKKRPMRQGPITWVLRNRLNDAAGVVLPQGSVAELAPAGDDESILYFDYNEQWQPARARDHIEFVSSNLRFVIGGVEAMPDLQFRLEWAGAKTEGGTVAYPGVGAAHPHWQFDVDYGWIGAGSMRALVHSAEGATIEVDLESEMEEIDLPTAPDIAVEPTPTRISATLAGFHHIHLPARALWHELECTMPEVALPQQHTPQSEAEIDRWLISALRYLKHEFELYL